MATKDIITGLVPEPEHQPTEPFVESAPRPRHGTERPKTSPYTSPTTRLIVGSEHKAYYVPRDLLLNTQLTSSFSSASKIYLPDVDEDTGHVLAHYLYTGTYQTLGGTVASRSEELRTEFNRAVMAYVTAISHEVNGLEQLAKEKIEHLGAEMDIVDIVEATKENFSRIPRDAAWFHGYLDQKANAAFDVKKKTDAAADAKHTENNMMEDRQASMAIYSLFDRIENVALMRALAKPLFEKYRAVCHACIEDSKNTRMTRENTTRSQSSPIEEVPEQGGVVTEELLVEEAHIEKERTEEVPIQETVLEEHVAVEEQKAQIEGRRDDTWNEGTVASNMTGEILDTVPKVEISSPHHLDSQSMAVPEPVNLTENLNDPWGDWGAPFWSQKKKSKKAPIRDALPSPPPEDLATKPPFNFDSTHVSKHQEVWRDDGFSPQDIPPPSTSNVEMEPCNKVSEEWRSNSISSYSKKKKKAKRTKTPKKGIEPVIEAPIDGPAPVEELNSVEVYYEKTEDVPLAEHQVVLEKMDIMQEPTTADVVEKIAPVPVEKILDDIWSLSSPNIGKKKRNKKGLLSAEASVSTNSATVEPPGLVSEVLIPATSAILTEGEQIIPTNPVGLNDSNTKSYPEDWSEQHVEVQNGVCPLFNEHMQQGHQWKTCQRCQNYLYGVAVNQVRKGFPNGLEVS